MPEMSLEVVQILNEGVLILQSTSLDHEQGEVDCQPGCASLLAMVPRLRKRHHPFISPDQRVPGPQRQGERGHGLGLVRVSGAHACCRGCALAYSHAAAYRKGTHMISYASRCLPACLLHHSSTCVCWPLNSLLCLQHVRFLDQNCR